MKKRNCFVSNSSSSSFIIALSELTKEQIDLIVNHSTEGQHYGISDGYEWAWNIDMNKHSIEGWTYMDNFDMQEYLDKIGVNPEIIKWGD